MTLHTLLRASGSFAVLLMLGAGAIHAQTDPFLDAYAPGREYFMLRSGSARMIIEANTTGTQPGVTYLLFDANRPCQTLRKERAFNYEPGHNCTSSALQVILGGAHFTALPHNCTVRWRQENGIPTVQAQWWAGGIRVTESFLALADANAFLRRITLEGADLAGPDSVRVALALPAGRRMDDRGMLASVTPSAVIAIGFTGSAQTITDTLAGTITTAPVPVRPHGSITLSTCLVLRSPLPGTPDGTRCAEDTPIPASVLRTSMDPSGAPGLHAAYFAGPDLAGTPVVERTDTVLSPYWGTSSPVPGIRPDSFSVRWTGAIIPPHTGTYRIALTADDRARVYLDGVLLIDRWKDACNLRAFADVPLTASTRLPIRVEYAELDGFAGMRFRWSVPPQPIDEPQIHVVVRDVFAFLRTIDDSPEDARLGMTFDAWKHASTVTSGDAMLDRLYDNARFALPGMVGPLGLMDAGIFEYGDQWVRDGSNVALGLIHAGYFESARALLTHILADLVADQGATIVAGAFDDPDREEFDQMGELMHTLKAWHDWTGDTTLIVRYRTKILTMIERPLRPSFRDSTGMVHNRREFWERTFTDGYELAYQTFMVQGLRDAAALAGILGVPERRAEWERTAASFLQAMLHHPSRALVQDGVLIKRRTVDGAVADLIPGLPRSSGRDDPATTEACHRLNPDASEAIPIFLRLVDPHSPLAKSTLDALEGIWNARWTMGGYERYHSSSQQDQPGPWCFATGFMARAQHEAGLYDRSYRSLAWLAGMEGGNAGAWPEEIPLNRSQIPTAGVVPWTSAEVTVFTVRHMLGVWFEGEDLALRPRLFPGNGTIHADLRFHESRIALRIDDTRTAAHATVDGIRIAARKDGTIIVPARMLRGAPTIVVGP